MKKLIQSTVSSMQEAVNSMQYAVCSVRRVAHSLVQLVKRLPTASCHPPTANLPTAKLRTANLPTANLPTAKPPTAYLKKLLTAILLTAYCQLATAQIYPVQVTPQLIPPYSLKLSDYQTTSSEKLFVNVLLTDTQELGRQVRLKMYIEGQGLNIQTLDFVAGASPLFLDGGINQRLSNLDLRAYFNLNNLLGLSPQQYNQALPDGRYNFCFEAYDFLSGQRLSRKSCFPVYLILNDPPILNIPNRGDLVTAQNPQNIIFNWTPRHLNATGVQYEFTLKELWDTGIDPQAAFLSSPPLFQTTTFATTLLHGPADIQLLEGKTYGWQVRALVSDGISETSVFRNNGHSEIYHFRYEGNCDPPSFVFSEAQNSQTVQITWQYSDHLRYEIQYRKKGYGDEDWFSAYAYNQQTTIHNLEAGTTYEFRVGGECTPQGGFAFSEMNEFTTPTEEETAYYNCGVMPEMDISNQNPLQNIGVNEVFTAGDFPVTVKEVTNSGGVYSGWGFITVPYLADTKIRVEFNDIHINTDFQLIQGVVETSYDADWEGIGDIDDLIDDIFGDDGEIDTFDASEIDIADIEVDENGNILLIDENGNEIPIEVDTPVIITDENGDQWQVDEDGNVSALGEEAEGGSPNSDNTNGVANNGDVTQISSSDVSVLFAPSGFYSTDQLRQNITDTSFTNKYESIPQANGGNYDVLYKAVSNAPQSTDQLIATATLTNGKTTDDIVFKTKQGTKVPATWSGNSATLTLEKQFDFAKEEILATVKPADSTANYDIAGKVNIWHLAQQQVNVTLVPVGNGAVSTNIADEINAIYNPAGVQFNITIAPTMSIDQSIWDVENANGKLDIGDSNTLANYTLEERAIYNYYKTQATLQDQMYYIFVLGTDITITDSATQGFMPLKRQYGFVFNPTNKSRTIAHELGHGIFGLEHPFTEYTIPQSTSDLLMDYGTGMVFTHMDWQKIHAPGLQLYIFQGDEDGELGGGKWLTANWKPFSFNESRIIFDPPGIQDIPIGSVPGIKYNGSVYVSNGNNFSKDGNNLPITLYNNLDDNKYVNLFRDNGGCDTDSYYKVKWKHIKNKQDNFSFDDSNLEYQGIIFCNSSSDTNSSTCDGFQDINEVNIDDKTAIADVLLENYNARNQITSEIRTAETFHHIVFDSGMANVDTQKLEILEEKLFLLKEHTGIHMMVIMHRIQNNSLYTQEAANDLAQQAIIEAGLENENIVLLAIPHANYESILWETSDTCIRIGLGQSGGTHATSHTFTSDVFNSILNTYASISKPYYLNYFFLASDGSLVDSKITSTQNKTGLPYINNIRFFESPKRTVLEQKRSVMTAKSLEGYQAKEELVSLQNELNSYEHYWDDGFESALANVNAKKEDIVQLQSDYQALKTDYNQSLLQFMQEDLVAFETGNINYWEPLEQGIGKFRECYMTDVDLVRSYMVKEVQDHAFGQQLDIVLGLSTLESHHFYAFDKWAPIDTAVYGVIDVAGFFPLVGEGADVVGALYAGLIRGDYSNAAMYSAGLAIPFVSGGVFKASDNLFVTIAKKSDDGTVQYLVKRADEVEVGELQIFSVIATTRSEAETLMNEALPHVNHNGIEELLNRISDLKNQADEILQYTDVVFSPEQINHFVSVSSEQNDKLKVMFGRWDNGDPTSYITRAGVDHSYFSMRDYWREASDLVDDNPDEIWKINKKYIDNQKALNKEFYFSHDPFSPEDVAYYAREINYLIELGVTDFKLVDNNLWKAIW